MTATIGLEDEGMVNESEEGLVMLQGYRMGLSSDIGGCG